MKLKYPFESMRMQDKMVAVPVGEGTEKIRGALKLNKTAAMMLELLKKDITEEQLVEAMMKKFDAPKEMILKDARKCIEEFREIGLMD